MFILKKAVINKYKSYDTEQVVELEDDITTLVGKNESGKTGFLEALAKLNYFTEDEDFEFNTIKDYPRNKLKKYQRSDNKVSPITCTFQLDQETTDKIKGDLGESILANNSFQVSSYYDSGRKWHSIDSDEQQYFENLQSKLGYSAETKEKLLEIGTIASVVEMECGENAELQSVIDHVKENIVEIGLDGWEHKLDGYIIKKYISPNLPRFWYFDEYYELPSRVSIDAIRNNSIIGELTKQQLEIAKALFEQAGINVNELADATNFESFIAELEATSNDITDTVFEYWSTNNNMAIEFKIDYVNRVNNLPPEKILDIRVKNERHRITLPLKNRSKGFNSFFSFVVWFSKIQDEKNKNFILLLDEPGLNLHASAQADLLRFINDLSGNYQIIYTTHSPFMVESDCLHRVRTVYDSEAGSVISDAIQEKDPDTLFPLQAALGYDIAQNLFVSKNNLLVEGPADLNYLRAHSHFVGAYAAI